MRSYARVSSLRRHQAAEHTVELGSHRVTLYRTGMRYSEPLMLV
jgi:hypothetical protein